jgi:hypothetical protein
MAIERKNPELPLDLSLEVMRRDAKPTSHIEPMRRCAVGSDAGVEMKALAAETPGLLGQPVHEPLAVTRTPRRRDGGDVVNVEVVTPGQRVKLPKPGGGYCIGLVSVENPDKAISGWP